MEIDKSYFKKVVSYIEKANKNPNIELEIRFWDKNYEKIEIDEHNFKNIFQYYTFSNENDGLGCKYNTSSSLDISLTFEGNNYNSILARTRLSIENSVDIKKYWLQNSLENIPYKIIEKKKLEKMDISEYFLRISLNEELPESEIFEKNKERFLNELHPVKSSNNNNQVNKNNHTLTKFYRLKNRYTITTPDELFVIDLTSVKSNEGKNFRDANVLKAIHNNEIEIEYIGNKGIGVDMDSEDICNKMFEHIHIILSIMNDSEFIMKQSTKNNIISSYTSMINKYKSERTFETKGDALFGNPVTIHRNNLIKSSNVNNLYNHYAVSLKADGLRVACFVMESSKPDLNGNIYLIDTNNNIIDTGFKDESYVNSIIEGEYLKENSTGKYAFYAYDMLYERGNDIRRRQYYNTFKEDRVLCRSVYLDRFIKSGSRKERIPQTVQIYRKDYRVSQTPDGNDIFEKAKQIWDTRTTQPFYVDGMIFTPMTEHYPLKSGSWYSLFKWKPPMLNTIDFLVRVVKNSNESEMKFPYLDSVLKDDGRIETVVRQYKKIKLNVGTLRDVYNDKNRRMTKKKFPTLFNPYDLNDDNAEAYNTCYVFIDENDKMICKDPISGEMEEMSDDTIVEFGFDPTKEKGFQWIPYRVRHDKTTSYRNGREVYGNLDKTANDIFRALQYSVTEEMITTGKNIQMEESGDGAIDAPGPYYAELKNGNMENNSERFPYQNFHNYHVKASLFKDVSPSMMSGSKMMSGKLLDLCCGKGVDLKKMKGALYAEVVGIDYDYENIKFAQKYYDRVLPKPKPKAYFVRGDAGKLIFPNQDAGFTESEKMQMKKFIQTKYYFDVVNVQFALHYFFENEIRLRTLLQNINDNLKIGGFFIGTCFDGERIHQMMKGVNEIEGKTFSGETLWKIQKKYSTTRMSFDATKPNYGKQIDVFVKSIGNVHSEYLVNFNYLDTIMEEYGFVKVMVKPFSQYYEELLKSEYGENVNQNALKNVETAKRMSEQEQKFSFLNNGFIYKKVSNSSDALFKKLVKMIEDQVKKEKKKVQDTEGVEVLDNETAHLVMTVEKEEEESTPSVNEEESTPSVNEEESTPSVNEEESTPSVNELNNGNTFVTSSVDEGEEVKEETMNGGRKIRKIRKSVTKKIKR